MYCTQLTLTVGMPAAARITPMPAPIATRSRGEIRGRAAGGIPPRARASSSDEP